MIRIWSDPDLDLQHLFVCMYPPKLAKLWHSTGAPGPPTAVPRTNNSQTTASNFKRQNTVESSTFGSEFIAMKIAVELIEGLRYKLRMMGVPVEDPCNVFCDNEAVVKNSTRPESTLKKKHQAIAYHRTREAQAAGTVRIAKEDGETNLADIFTKLLAGPKLRDLSQRILW